MTDQPAPPKATQKPAGATDAEKGIALLRSLSAPHDVYADRCRCCRAVSELETSRKAKGYVKAALALLDPPTASAPPERMALHEPLHELRVKRLDLIRQVREIEQEIANRGGVVDGTNIG